MNVKLFRGKNHHFNWKMIISHIFGENMKFSSLLLRIHRSIMLSYHIRRFQNKKVFHIKFTTFQLFNYFIYKKNNLYNPQRRTNLFHLINSIPTSLLTNALLFFCVKRKSVTMLFLIYQNGFFQKNIIIMISSETY